MGEYSRRSDNGRKSILSLVGLATLLVIGLVTLVLSCTLYGNWHPFASFPFLIVVPFPIIVGKQFANEGFFSDDISPAMECAYFISASLFTTAVVIPFFFYQLGSIKVINSPIMAAVGVVIMTTAATLYHLMFNTENV